MTPLYCLVANSHPRCKMHSTIVEGEKMSAVLCEPLGCEVDTSRDKVRMLVTAAKVS